MMDGTMFFEGTIAAATQEAIEQRLGAGQFFWLDLDGVDDEAHDLLLNVFKIHHLAVDDVQHFGQRPKFEDYDDFMYMVVHGASGDHTSTDEVHFIFADKFLITVHRGPCQAMNAVLPRIAHHRAS